jgi:hypothetical protein
MGIVDGFSYPRWEKNTAKNEIIHELPSTLKIQTVVSKARLDAESALSSLGMYRKLSVFLKW